MKKKYKDLLERIEKKEISLTYTFRGKPKFLDYALIFLGKIIGTARLEKSENKYKWIFSGKIGKEFLGDELRKKGLIPKFSPRLPN